MARIAKQFSCCRIKGRKSGLFSCVLIREAMIDRLIVFHSTPHHHLVGWSGNEWLSQRLRYCFDPGVPGMQGCEWNARGVIACCVKWWKTFFFFSPFCFDRLQAYCVTLLVSTNYSLTTRFPFIFISYTVMIEVFYACVFVPFFYRTLMPLMAVMENETWIQPSNIPHYLLHGDPFASRLSREADIVAALYICIIGQWLIAKKEKSYYYSSPGSKWQ